MVSLKDFTENNQLIASIINIVEPKLDYIVSRMKQDAIDNGDNNFKEEYAKLILVYKLLSSIEKYTLSTDKLENITFSSAQNGNLTISSNIIRDGISYPFSTDVIYAGGYNIQTLHIRYVVNTKLKQTNTNVLTKQLNDKIKSLTNIEKLQIEKEDKIQRIEKLKEQKEYILSLSQYNDIKLHSLIQTVYNEPILKGNLLLKTIESYLYFKKSFDDTDINNEMYAKRKEIVDTYFEEIKLSIKSSSKNIDIQINDLNKSLLDINKKIEKYNTIITKQ